MKNKSITYEVYKLNTKEFAAIAATYTLFSLIVAYVFFDSLKAFCVLFIFMPIYISSKKRMLKRKREKEIKEQFLGMIGSMSQALSAGFSVENSIDVIVNDMEKQYGKDAYIISEMEIIKNEMKLSVPIDKCLINLSKRVNIEEVNDFVLIFAEAIRSGGNLVEIIRETSFSISEKRKIDDEIISMLNGKLLEQKVMCVMPFLIIIYLRVSSRKYISVLYHNPLGIAVMIVCLLLYVSSIVISKRIIDIKI